MSVASAGVALRRCLALTSFRNLFTSSVRPVKRITEAVTGNTITIEGVIDSEDFPGKKLLQIKDEHGGCPLCRLNKFVKYDDVLILEQFMRPDGTVLPKEITGLCPLQQTVVERCVMQAHWSGLFPHHVPKLYTLEEHRSGYKQFNRYWDDNREMFSKKLTVKPGAFYYIKKYRRLQKNS